MRDASERVAAARACVGARFRLHGRDPAFGLDCVGVAACAFGRPAPATYPIRGGAPAEVARAIDAIGLVRGEPGPGDLVLLDMGARQLHLAVLTPAGFVHADARLRRVVETPGAPAGAILAAWTEAR